MSHLINSVQQTFGLCSIQSGLREVGLYDGNIDGLFGPLAYRGFETLLGEPFHHTAGFSAKQVFLYLQKGMASVGKDTGGFDGIWGRKSQRSFTELLAAYRRKKGLPEYWYAWSGHKRVTQKGVRKIRTWITSFDKPDDHVGYLLTCIDFETAGTFSPGKENPASHAIGLIQFMPTKLKEWDVDDEDFASLSFDKQLNYVFRFFEEYDYIQKCQRLEDYYLSIFYPSLVGKGPDHIIARRGSSLYTQNQPAFDKNKKGFYTTGDVAEPIFTRYWQGLAPENRLKTTQLER